MDNWTRHIELEGCLNLRDVGDYPARGGRRTRRGVLLRSDSLANLPEASREALRERGVHTIIDLRGEWELSAAPSIFARSGDITYYNVPVLTEEHPAWMPPSPYTLDDMYCLWLDRCAGQLGLVMRTLARSVDGREGAVVIHCAGGKDRTGVVAGILLSLAGVPPEVIAEDYALTAGYLAPAIEELRKQAALFAPDPHIAKLWVESPPEAMLRTLACLEERHGGAENYLRATGLSEEEVSKLRELLIDRT